jgi:hypothetical protein
MRRSILCAMSVTFVMLSSTLTSTSAHVTSASAHVWKRYTNVRFQYSICYPEDLLVPQGESPNSDGQKFLAKDGAQLVVFGRNNAIGESLNDALASTEARLTDLSGKTTYKALRPDWFVVSGQNGNTDFYARTRYSRDQLKSFELTYDHSAAVVYKPLIGRLTTCFTDHAR